jgi:hypothetical protein
MVHYSLLFSLVCSVVLLKVFIVSDHFTDLVIAILTVGFVHIDVLIADSSTIPSHLKLFIDFKHDKFQLCEKVFVEKVLLKLLNHISSELSVVLHFLLERIFLYCLQR